MPVLHGALVVVVDLDELVNVIPCPDGIGELVDERAAVAAVQASRAGRGRAGGDVRPTAQRSDRAAGGALEVEAGVRIHGHRRALDRRAARVLQRVRLAAVDLRHRVGGVDVDDVRCQRARCATQAA